MPVKFVSGKVAHIAEDSKYAKHSMACSDAGFGFVGFAADAFGCFVPSAIQMLKRIAHMLETTKSYPPYLAANIVLRRISFANHLGVARQM
eukprot:gene42814-53439_t